MDFTLGGQAISLWGNPLLCHHLISTKTLNKLNEFLRTWWRQLERGWNQKILNEFVLCRCIWTSHWAHGRQKIIFVFGYYLVRLSLVWRKFFSWKLFHSLSILAIKLCKSFIFYSPLISSFSFQKSRCQWGGFCNLILDSANILLELFIILAFMHTGAGRWTGHIWSLTRNWWIKYDRGK